MVKSPLEYVESQSFDVKDFDSRELSHTEQLFMQKYLGIEADKDVETKILDKEVLVESSPIELKEPGFQGDVSIDNHIREDSELHLVGFQVGDQFYTIPTVVVQEVIRKMPVSKLPTSSAVVSGVIKLRGYITPIVHLRKLVGMDSVHTDKEDIFTIICRCHGFQLGLQIDKVHNMYRVQNDDIQWNVETLLGMIGGYAVGIFKLHEKIVPILSVERIVEEIFQ